MLLHIIAFPTCYLQADEKPLFCDIHDFINSKSGQRAV